MGHWTLEQRGSVAVATFARPPRNLMSMAAMAELEDLVEAIAADDTTSVLVLTGGVPGYFVAHADVEDLLHLARGEPVEGDPMAWVRTLARLASMPQPVVAAVNGQAWGGGCELALACTVRLAATSAHFAQPEAAVGIIPGAGGTQRLARLVGAGPAAAMVLTGREIGAEEAHRVGLVEAVLPDDGFLDRVLEWVAPMAGFPRHAVTAAKRSILDGLGLPLAEGLAQELDHFLACLARPETARLMEAVVERYRNAGPEERVRLD